ncbi:hypothetical protein BJ138DRAFT_1142929 [Hygrophoropsis aurantiaca]|uniref:Uncharacterized protein n=1 Tax=Hygrophoropsis aurantiaca TaxID=72124 RepID=A0ACB8APQ7_9AGAM|nr:hypothetical protein BJ138DRAFT_1142929 [Hygrophoropsis aurantiaca]
MSNIISAAICLLLAIQVLSCVETRHECSYEDNVTRFGDSIAWKFRVHSGVNCTGTWRGYRGHIFSDAPLGGCSQCIPVTGLNYVKSFAFTTAGKWWDTLYNQNTIAAIHLYQFPGCHDADQIGTSKGKWMKDSVTELGEMTAAFKVCLESYTRYGL